MSNEPNQNSTLTEEMVEWVVNNSGELGVKIGGRFFFLYKGGSLEYTDAQEVCSTPMLWRHVGKREFGETCHPLGYYDKDGKCRFPGEYDEPLLPGIGWAGDPSDLEWKPLPLPVKP